MSLARGLGDLSGRQVSRWCAPGHACLDSCDAVLGLLGRNLLMTLGLLIVGAAASTFRVALSADHLSLQGPT